MNTINLNTSFILSKYRRKRRLLYLTSSNTMARDSLSKTKEKWKICALHGSFTANSIVRSSGLERNSNN